MDRDTPTQGQLVWETMENPSGWWRSIGYFSGGLVALGKPLKAKIYLGENQDIGLEKSLVTPYKIIGSAGKWSGEDCVLSSNNEVGSEFITPNCTLGNFYSAKRRILVIGNSFSASFVHAFDDLVQDENFSVTITSAWGASAVPELINTTLWNEANDYYWQELLPPLIGELRRGDIVFAINDLHHFSPKNIESRKSLEFLSIGIKNLSNKLSKQGIQLVFMHGLPFAREANCKPEDLYPQWFQALNQKIVQCKMPGKEESFSRRRALDTALRNLNEEGYVEVIDLFGLFCPNQECSYFGEDNIILYRDQDSHPSAEAARMSAPSIKKFLMEVSKKI